MRMHVAVAALVVLVTLATSVSAVEVKEKWVYYSGGGRSSQGAFPDDFIAFMKDAKALGVTHIQFNGSEPPRTGEIPKDYLDNAKKALDAAKEMGITIVPGVYPVGYSGGFLGQDPNLASGIPVRDARFVVKDGVARPDPAGAPFVQNGSFDDADGDTLKGWTKQDLPGVNSFVDRETKHGGAASVKFTALDKLPASVNGDCRVSQILKVTPFQNYRLSVWTKTDAIDAEREDYLILRSPMNVRRYCYSNFRVRPPQDWTLQSVTFNSLEATEIELSVGVSTAKSGTIWFDDLTIEPAGLADVVRREITPLTVTSLDKSVTYVEGKDFEPIPGGVFTRYRRGEAPEVPPIPGITLTSDSRMKNGDTILVSFFHTTRIYDSQMVISIQDPKVFDMMDEQMKRMSEAWPTNAYFMKYDEIRIGGWEVQPAGEKLTLGQMLARHVSRGVSIIKKYAPDAKIYVWSDMFDPFHNGRPFAARNGYYYLCNGNWDGSWEGLPKEVGIMNWNGTENAAKSLQWFAGRGYTQIIAGYYDGDPKENIATWMKASEGVPNIVGMMYTTWRRDYAKMPEFFQILKDWPEPAK